MRPPSAGSHNALCPQCTVDLWLLGAVRRHSREGRNLDAQPDRPSQAHIPSVASDPRRRYCEPPNRGRVDREGESRAL